MGPYMRDGKFRSLEDVVEYYPNQGKANPYFDKEMKKIYLTARDRSDLVAFLKSLTGNAPLDEKRAPVKAVHP
jgi:cytochrome c peroxidase